MFSQPLKRLAAPALIVGGLLWVATAIASIIVGMVTGKVTPFPDAHSPAIVYIGMWLFPLAILPLSIGLLGLFARLEGRARGLGITGVVLTGMGAILGIGALIVLSTIFGTSNLLDGLLGGFGSFATIIGSGFLGWAALRARTLPRWVALAHYGLCDGPVHFRDPFAGWATLGDRLSGILVDSDCICCGRCDVRNGPRTRRCNLQGGICSYSS